MSLAQNLRAMERSREAYWLRYPGTSPVKLRWRALTVRHCFHILPGETLLEIGAGSGLWTEHLTTVLRGENPITAAVFNEDFMEQAAEKQLAGAKFVYVHDLMSDLPAESFDYVIGTAILCHDRYTQHLQAIYRLLKPGGQLLFFEANYWNPQVFLKSLIRPLGCWTGEAPCQIGMRRYRLMQVASHQGFTHLNVTPYDIIHPLTPGVLIRLMQSMAFIFEQTPLIREVCGTLYIWAKKPGDEVARRPRVNLAKHAHLFHSTSVVVPCHNEEMNIPHLVNALVQMYDHYIHEIIIVNDNSTDRTSAVTREVAKAEPRVKLVDRQPPNGVGRALRDGYAAASGHYILTMDCDFIHIVPELRDLFDVIAEGRDGAIGSRFSHESVLINYPFFKILCNRGFHLFVKWFLLRQVRDITNNFKLYRAEILRNLQITAPHFAANVETGLKPLLDGYDLREVPISWINRTSDMGRSSFKLLHVAPSYLAAICRIMHHRWRARRQLRHAARGASLPHKPERRS
ncbi:MAG TPA: glycosyltransferase [Alphaproteobacteria bacterium]|nr:glycosyltransferase [Alphaproteobacteria bacterium]